MATFVQPGNTVDYTPGSDLTAGAVVVQVDLVGVLVRDTAANKLGALAVEGVHAFPKATSGGSAIPAGTICYWSAGSQQATATAGGNKLIGKCVKAAADADTVVLIKLSQ